jgi:Tfp pilus assembly protein PilX
MQQQAPEPHKHPKQQEAAFLVISMILLLVISAIGLASMAATTASLRVSQNYGKSMQALEKAQSMAQYAKRILETYPDTQYPGPGTCTSYSTCNVIDTTFPNSGRPILAWTSAPTSGTLYGSSESDSWWNTNAYPYQGTFIGSGNARVVVELLGADASSPYEHTYKIVGFATDSTGTVKATYQMYHVWNGYTPDPGNGTCTSGNSCDYTQCCSSTTTCATDEASCEGGSATYVPPDWSCTDYFVTGLGYSSAACTNPITAP